MVASFVLFCFAVFMGLRKKSRAWFSAAGVFLVTLVYYGFYFSVDGLLILPPYFSFSYFEYILDGRVDLFEFSVCAGALTGFLVAGRFFSKDTDLSQMWLVVGRVLDTKTSRDVYSNTHVTRDAAGKLNSYTTHDVVVSHSTWLHDLNKDVDVNYSGSGSIQARPGHILGTMSYKGFSCMDINYSTGNVFSIKKVSNNFFGSLLQATVFFVFGFIALPVFLLLLVFRPGLALFGGVPGAFKTNLTFMLLAAAIYLVMVFLFLSVTQGNLDPSSFGICLGVAFFCYVALFQKWMAILHKRDVVILEAGKKALDQLYEAAMVKEAARSAAGVGPAGAVTSESAPAS